jgi:hypothetical protein
MKPKYSFAPLVDARPPVLTPEELIRGFGHLLGMDDVANIENMALTVLEFQRQYRLDWADGKHRRRTDRTHHDSAGGTRSRASHIRMPTPAFAHHEPNAPRGSNQKTCGFPEISRKS